MVSQGGVAGAGETLRRLDWSELRADGENVLTDLDDRQLGALDPVPKDQWPTQ
jgi:hypothetical protein